MNYKRKKTNYGQVRQKLSPQKKRIFFFVIILLPFLLLLLVESSLRIFQYDGNLDLFIEGPAGYGEYLRCNPNVARRYFNSQSSIPTPPKQLFLKQKPSNGFRIFILGESSAAGFPYGNNASFPNILERGLSNAFPDKRIEVVNVAMAAINSYTLLDIVDEVFRQSPDALLIYAGHNEYYGALGVGSVQTLGNSRWLIRAYLKCQSLKSFLLLRDTIGWLRSFLGKIFLKGNVDDPSATLMERIVGEQTIPFGSSLYLAGIEQFKENMESILRKASEKQVPVVLSELVSNIRDQEPFISVKNEGDLSAAAVYSYARKLESEGQFDKAKFNYYRAKDRDALRFRAPEEINEVIRELGARYLALVVPAISFFENQSPHGLIGSTLMLEHLHPNIDGYYLLAKAFFETLRSNKLISQTWTTNTMEQERRRGITVLDSVYSSLVIQQLKAGWPFQPRYAPNRFMQNFVPSNRVEDIAFRVMKSTNFSIEAGHMELGEYFEKDGKLDAAYNEYSALITSIPHEQEFYQKAALILLSQKEYEKANTLLLTSLRYKDNMFAYKWIGQIALMKEQYKEAVSFLKRADQYDAQVVFNLCRAYYQDGQWEIGEEYYQKLRTLSPRSQYFTYLTQLRTVLRLKDVTANKK